MNDLQAHPQDNCKQKPIVALENFFDLLELEAARKPLLQNHFWGFLKFFIRIKLDRPPVETTGDPALMKT